MLAWFLNYRVKNNTSTYNQKSLSVVITTFLLYTNCHDIDSQTVYALNRTILTMKLQTAKRI